MTSEQATPSDYSRRNEFLKLVGMHESQDRGQFRDGQRNELLKKVGLHIMED